MFSLVLDFFFFGLVLETSVLEDPVWAWTAFPFFPDAAAGSAITGAEPAFSGWGLTVAGSMGAAFTFLDLLGPLGLACSPDTAAEAVDFLMSRGAGAGLTSFLTDFPEAGAAPWGRLSAAGAAPAAALTVFLSFLAFFFLSAGSWKNSY